MKNDPDGKKTKAIKVEICEWIDQNFDKLKSIRGFNKMAKSAYRWTKVSEGGKWVHYCTSHDLPHIINLKNDKYKVEAGKDSRIEDDWESSVKYAIEIGKKRAKAVRKFEKQEAK